LRDIKIVVVCPYFWCCAFFALAVSGIFSDLSGMWVAPWLRDLFGMSKQEAGNMALSLSIGPLTGALGIPVLSSLVRTKKWTLFASLLTAISLLVWQLRPAHMPYGLLYFLLMLIGGIVCGCIATCPLPVLPTLLERVRLRNDVTEGSPDAGLNRGFRKFLMTVSRPVARRLSSAKFDKIKHAPLSIPRSALTFREHVSEQILPLDQLFHTGRPTGVLNRRFAKLLMGAEGARDSDAPHSGEA
jgi:Na+/melibiose symporter-like transporter